MKWSAQQERALREVDQWLTRLDKPFFNLSGYAGTGKTTLARHFAESVGGNVLFGAYTGKAAHVLQQKGCPGAATVHSLIYLPKEKSRKRLTELEAQMAEYMRKGLDEEDPRVVDVQLEINRERVVLSRPAFSVNEESLVRQASLVILDECSMIGSRIGHDLLSFNVPVLALGDPGQLPPTGDAAFFTSEPDFLLTEIHRQAAGSPVIELATKARKGEPLDVGQYGESRVVRRGDLTREEIVEHDQMLVGKNVTRTQYNRAYRDKVLGFDSEFPVTGDRLVCLRNDYDEGLLNGSIWYCTDSGVADDDTVTISVVPEDDRSGPPLVVDAHKMCFIDEEKAKQMPWWERKEAQEFTYGYALTCHKAQGSQWDAVVIRDESHVFRDKKRNWLYTAITRAAERVTIIQEAG